MASVVPMFRISEQPSGTARATASAMRCLPAACSPLAVAMFSMVEASMRTPP